MSENSINTTSKLPLTKGKALEACWKPILLNWLIPGLGYFVIKDKLRATCLFGVWALFLIMAFLQLNFGAVNGITGGVFTPKLDPFEWMPTLGALATSGVGPVYGFFAAFFGGAGAEPVRNLTQEYGATYLMVAGLLNWLSCFDLFDRTTNRWFWRLPDDEREELMPKKRVDPA